MRREVYAARARTMPAMARIFITGDTHFGHADAIPLFKRPFTSVEEMDAAMVEGINSSVDRKDTLIHIGDFTGPADWKEKSVRERARELRDSIRCREMILIRGNHDPRGEKSFNKLFSAIHDLYSFRGWAGGRERINCCHYSLRVWRGRPKGAFLLYGHTHGTLEEIGRSTDVGVDCWGFKPMELDGLLSLLAARPLEPSDGWPRRQESREPPVYSRA